MSGRRGQIQPYRWARAPLVLPYTVLRSMYGSINENRFPPRGSCIQGRGAIQRYR